jgi:hypothetical protein
MRNVLEEREGCRRGKVVGEGGGPEREEIQTNKLPGP